MYTSWHRVKGGQTTEDLDRLLEGIHRKKETDKDKASVYPQWSMK